MTQPRLEVGRLVVGYGSRPIISSASFTLPSAMLAGLVGPNGAGKSTLLSAMAGQLPYQGTVKWSGAPLEREMLAYLPQSHGFHSGLTVVEVVLLGRRDHLRWKVPKAELEAAAAVLKRFAASDLADRPMQTLSGGQQQIILLAQRLVGQPRILLLDEPTSALDLRHQLSVMAILRDYVAQQDAVAVAAIHDLGLAGSQCDNILLLHEGEIAASGPADAVLTAESVGSVYRVVTEAYSNREGRVLHVPVAAIEDASVTPPQR